LRSKSIKIRVSEQEKSALLSHAGDMTLADFHLVNNWQNYINARYEFSDPNDPSKKRLLITASDMPDSRTEAVEQINAGLTELVKSGAVNERVNKATGPGGTKKPASVKCWVFQRER
jgi:hypothetical protein